MFGAPTIAMQPQIRQAMLGDRPDLWRSQHYTGKQPGDMVGGGAPDAPPPAGEAASPTQAVQQQAMAPIAPEPEGVALPAGMEGALANRSGFQGIEGWADMNPALRTQLLAASGYGAGPIDPVAQKAAMAAIQQAAMREGA